MIYNKNRKWICIFAAALISFLFIFFQYRVYNLNFNTMPETGGDSMIYTITVKSMLHDGLKGVWINSQLGAPEVSSLVDTPFLDYPMAIMGWLFAIVTSSVSASFYIMYIITYPLAAAAMSYLLSKITNKAWINICFSVIYALLPYHFMRSTGHLTLSVYYMLPIGVYLGILMVQREFTGIIADIYSKSKVKMMFLYIAAFFIGMCNGYYALFCMMILFCALIYKMISKQSFRPLIKEAFLLYFMAAGFLVSMLPKIIYTMKNGANLIAGTRQPLEAEMYGLKLIQLFMPANYTRVKFLYNIQAKYVSDGFLINENITSSLGLVGIIGFLILCGWLIFRLIRTDIKVDHHSELLTFLSFCTIAAFLFATVGGIGSIVSHFVVAQFRGLNRISILIDTLSIAGAAVFLDKYWRKILIPVLLLVCCVTWYADVPYTIPKEAHPQNTALMAMYQEFFDKIEKELPENAMVYTLPMVEFPESAPVNSMIDYSQTFGYAMTDNLRWSYGGMKGRQTKAMSMFIDNGMSMTFIDTIVKNGFSGVYINTDAYTDAGAAINSFYQNTLKLKPLVSGDGKLYFYNLDNLDKKS